VTFDTILTLVGFDAGDTGAEYKNRARDWLNIVRSEIADEAQWRWALRPEGTLDTVADQAYYNLTDASTGDKYDHIAGDFIYDQNNDTNITYEAFGPLHAQDQDLDITGPPAIWSDAGATSSGDRQIILWPVPDSAYTLVFPGVVLFSDITESDDSATVDPFFGPIAPWNATFMAGMRWQYAVNNNEDPNQILLYERMFRSKIRKRMSKNRVSPTSAVRNKVVNRLNRRSMMGRLDPSRFAN
jgi:hypothetical protein